jgi:hypothetical protein
MSNSPRRRWFRIGLWMLLAVVAVSGVWLAQELRIVHERQRLWRTINEAGGYAVPGDFAMIPKVRALLGDIPWATVAVPEASLSPGEMATVKSAFPEAEIVRGAKEAELGGDDSPN